MKNNVRKLFASLVTLCMVFSVIAVPAFAADTTDTQQPTVIGGYDGYITDAIADGYLTTTDSECLAKAAAAGGIANVRINSYATYDTTNGIQVHVKLYVPWYDFPKPEFTGMTGTVNVLMNKRSTSTPFIEIAAGDSTIETDVSTGRTASSGTEGTVSVSGVATAYNALMGGGVFSISFPVTIP